MSHTLMRQVQAAVLAWCAATVCAPGVDSLDPASPLRLVDLRWLARAPEGEYFCVDRLAPPATTPVSDKDAEGFLLADIEGPGVCRHLVTGLGRRLTIEVDGVAIWRGEPGADWLAVYLPPADDRRGTAPWVFPLVQRAGPFGECLLPIPFRDRLLVRGEAAGQPIRVAGYRLPSPSALHMADSRFVEEAGAAARFLAGAVTDVEAPDGSRQVEIDAFLAPGGEPVVVLQESGPGEIVGLVLDVTPAAYDLARHAVVEIFPDGRAEPSLRMPMVDLLGVSHPWSHAWLPIAGDQVAGLLHPHTRNRMDRQREVLTIYFKLPMPYGDGIRMVWRNRSRDLPLHVRGSVRVAPLSADEARKAYRLCGTSVRSALSRPEGVERLFTAAVDGRLVGLAFFTTGHDQLYSGDHRWRRQDRLEWVNARGEAIGGRPDLLPTAYGSTSPVFTRGTWNQNSAYPHGAVGGGTHFWPAAPPLAAGDALDYRADGMGGPTLAECSLLWYQPEGPDLFRAPPLPDDVAPFPDQRFVFPDFAEGGGWSAEAEDLVLLAETDTEPVRVGTAGARDVQASGGAYLAWDAPGPGAVMDLVVPTPPSRYTTLAFSQVLLPAGGVFNVELAAAGNTAARPLFEKGDTAFLDRVLGRAGTVCSLDGYNAWPWARHKVFRLPPLLSPEPGRPARLRFTCVTKRGRAYLLSLDQLGLEAAPPTPAGWTEFEDQVPPALQPSGMDAVLMPHGREDFHGWGGWRVRSTARGPVTLRLAAWVAGPPAERIEFRGVVRSGEWTAGADGAAAVPLAGAEADGPRTWSVPLPSPLTPPFVITLNLTCTTAPGELLLDAWR